MPKQNTKKSQRGQGVKDLESLPTLNQNAAGIDVGSAEHHVAVPAGRDAEPVQKFGSFTADLHRMARWLKACGVETVAMQATATTGLRPICKVSNRTEIQRRILRHQSASGGVIESKPPGPTCMRSCTALPVWTSHKSTE